MQNNSTQEMNPMIYPCLWCDNNANEAANFYAQVFKGQLTVQSPMVSQIKIFGQTVMLLNGGAQFEKNASISFLIVTDSEQEIDEYWSLLSDGGIPLMPLASYPWSKKYGWVRDKFGTTWQLFWAQEINASVQRLVPNLMFINENNGKAIEAMKFYNSIFPNAKIDSVLLYKDGQGAEENEIPDHVQHAEFILNGYKFGIMDSSLPHRFNFNEGISLVVTTQSQEETDHYWHALTQDGGQEQQCGWLKDKYGVSWQIVPKQLAEIMNDQNNPNRAQKAMQALMKMSKIVIAELG